MKIRNLVMFLACFWLPALAVAGEVGIGEYGNSTWAPEESEAEEETFFEQLGDWLSPDGMDGE